MLDNFIDENKENIINSVCKLIKYPSVSIENLKNTDAPFGEACFNVLKEILFLGESMGFRTKNIDNYCGYIEFGEGEELVGIIGHLDVVPANIEDGWTTPPFEASIRDGKIFGRGAIDDKGPVIASLYAMKAVKESFKINKRVRLILGLNEEKNWRCINYYKKNEEHPSISFSPDANFPAIYAEKGIMSIALKHRYLIKDIDILNINCGNNALNVVPKYCSITIQSKNGSLNLLPQKNELYNTNINITELENNTYKIESFGKASHAAHPELGINAISNLVHYLIDSFDIPNIPEYEYLKKLYELGFFEIESPEFLERKDIAFPTEFEDHNVIQDESGILTSNVAFADYKDNILTLKINLRVPVRTTLDEIERKYKSLLKIFEDIEVSVLGRQNPLLAEKDSFLVKTLVDIFNEKTNLNEKPIAIGGGTYARAFKNSISYGLTFPGEKDMCHQVDEFVEIDKLITGAKIYAEAIYRLAK